MSLPQSAWIYLPHNPGDVVMGLQVFAWLQTQVPDIKVDYWVGEESADLLQDLGLAKALSLPRYLVKEAWKTAQLAPAWDAINTSITHCQKMSYDLGINLFQEQQGGVVSGLLPARKRVGLYLGLDTKTALFTRAMGHLFSLSVQRQLNPFHAIDIYQHAVTEAWNSTSLHLPTEHPIHPLSKKFKANRTGLTKVALHLGSAWAGKRYSITSWVALAKLLLDAGWQIHLTGSTEEQHLAEAFLNELNIHELSVHLRGQVLSHVGTSTLSQLTERISEMNWVISGDTVAMHLAAAVGTPVLALFGASNPIETGPYGKGHFIFETELGEYPENLAFKTAHNGLDALPPGEIAAFLLEGKSPLRARVWETDWWAEGRCQVLRDRHGEIRNRSLITTWNHLLNSLPKAGQPNKTGQSIPIHSLPKPSLAQNWENSWHALINSPDPRALDDFHQVETAWSEATQKDLIWEAYRIAVNAIRATTLTESLKMRRERWDLAWQESAAIQATLQSIIAEL